MSFKNLCLRWGTFFSALKFEKDCQDIRKSFDQTWRKTRRSFIGEGLFWVEQGFNKQSNFDDFPITEYAFYHEAMEKSIDQGISRFTGEKVLFAPMTSGTNGSMKPFIITKSYKKQYQMVSGPTVHYLTKQYDIGKAKFIYLISLSSAGFSERRTPTGTIGNFTYQSLPGFLKAFYAMPFSIFKNEEIFKRNSIYYCLANDVSAIFSVTPQIAINFLSRIQNSIQENFDQLIEDLESGQSGVAITKSRLNYLKSLDKKQDLSLKKLWPSLVVATTWKSSICELSLPEMGKLIGEDTPIVDGIYSATEGWVTVQNEPDTMGTTFHPGGTLLEFIEIGADTQKENLVKPWDLKIGKEYEVFYTNNMGLIRYRIGDIIECTGFFKQSPILQFKRKVSSSLSLGILRINEAELIESSDHLRSKGLPYKYLFSFSHDGKSLGLYIQTDELSEGLKKQIMTDASLIDSKLQSISADYKKERDNKTLLSIQCYRLPKKNSYFLTSETGQEKQKLIIQEQVEYTEILF